MIVYFICARFKGNKRGKKTRYLKSLEPFRFTEDVDEAIRFSSKEKLDQIEKKFLLRDDKSFKIITEEF